MEKEGVWMALPIAIVEDQTPDAQRLEELLQQQLPEAECTWFACGDDFLRAAAEPGLYAVVFLDICMAGTNGIETARRLRQADPEVLIVFVTSSPEYVWDAFPVHPFDYLLKPYQEEKFEHLAAELRRALRCKEPELEIRIARQSIQLPLRKVLYEMYRVAREFTRNARLDRENQLLAMESRRYMELQTYLDNTRRLRHDFRQHLHVIAGLTETGQLEELKSYLHQYESELSEHRPTLCANAAVDALAGYYDHAAGQQDVPVEWKLALPRQLPMPEADLCTILGNLLENALHASQKLPPEQRRVQVMAQMLSPAMLGLVVENRYDGVLKKQQGILHSTKHEGTGIGLVSAEMVVHKYNGSLHLETEEHLFRVNVLLNL